MSDPYKVLLALHHDHRLETWCQVARQITPEDGEIHLRGMVTVPADYSLSEGARAARQWRGSFQQVALSDEPSMIAFKFMETTDTPHSGICT